MRVHPSDLLHFLADHFDLMVALVEAQPFTRPQLMGIIDQHVKPDGLNRDTIVRRLEEHGCVDESGDANKALEVPPWLTTLLQRLQGMHKMSSAATIQAKLDDLDQHRKDLSTALDRQDENLALEATREITIRINDLRTDARENLETVINEVIRFKGDREEESLAQRYARIRRLWERYIIPLGEIIDIHQAADRAFERLSLTLRVAQETFVKTPAMENNLYLTRIRLNRLREQLVQWHLSAVMELRPLYHRLRMDHEIARGTTIILEKIGRDHRAADDFARSMGMPGLKLVGLFSDPDVVGFLHEVKSYTVKQQVLIPNESNLPDQRIPIVDWEACLNKLHVVGSKNVLEWLFKEYKHYPFWSVFRAYAQIIANAPDLVNGDKAVSEFSHYVVRYYAREKYGSDTQKERVSP
jgi:hypothetical protein